MSLFEQYRPRTLADVVGQAPTVERLSSLAKRGLAGRAYWFAGLSGTGKTTLARIVAAQVAQPLATEEVNAADVTVEDIRRWEHEGTVLPDRSGLTGRAYILNEAHLMRKPIVSRLLTTLEAIPRHAVYCFTTTTAGQEALFDGCLDAHPLLSRCIELELETADYKLGPAFAARVRQIAVSEGIDGKPLEWYEQLAAKARYNMRAMFQAVESGA